MQQNHNQFAILSDEMSNNFETASQYQMATNQFRQSSSSNSENQSISYQEDSENSNGMNSLHLTKIQNNYLINSEPSHQILNNVSEMSQSLFQIYQDSQSKFNQTDDRFQKIVTSCSELEERVNENRKYQIEDTVGNDQSPTEIQFAELINKINKLESSQKEQKEQGLNEEQNKDHPNELRISSLESLVEEQKKQISKLEQEISLLKKSSQPSLSSNKQTNSNSKITPTSSKLTVNLTQSKKAEIITASLTPAKITSSSINSSNNTTVKKESVVQLKSREIKASSNSQSKNRVITIKDNFEIVVTSRDGNCFYSSLKASLNIQQTVQQLKDDVAQYAEENLSSFEFISDERKKTLVAEIRKNNEYAEYDVIKIAADFLKTPILLFRNYFNLKASFEHILPTKTAATSFNSSKDFEKCALIVFYGKLNAGHFNAVRKSQSNKTGSSQSMNSSISGSSQSKYQKKQPSSTTSLSKSLPSSSFQRNSFEENSTQKSKRVQASQNNQLSKSELSLESKKQSFYCGCGPKKHFKNLSSLKSHFYQSHKKSIPPGSSHDLRGKQLEMTESFQENSSAKGSNPQIN